MSRASLIAAIAMASVAGALLDDREYIKSPTPEESERRRQEREARDKAERRDRAARSARYQAEQDAIAAPYREARRLRNLKKMGKS